MFNKPGWSDGDVSPEVKLEKTEDDSLKFLKDFLLVVLVALIFWDKHDGATLKHVNAFWALNLHSFFFGVISLDWLMVKSFVLFEELF